MIKTTQNDILYYDGSCPLCAKEIQWLKKHQRGQLDFKDLHAIKKDELPASRAEMLQKLHLFTHDQGWTLGLDATVRAWAHTPYGWIVKPLRWPLIKHIADWIYTRWATKRYHKRFECNACSSYETSDKANKNN